MANRYSVVCKLIDKTATNVTAITAGIISAGDLTPWLNRLEYTNTGIEQQNFAQITLDVPTDGTFIRKAPILVDKEAKHNYLIDVQITSDGNVGKLFRGMLAGVHSNVSASGGEQLVIPLAGIELAMQESFDGFRSRTTTPFDRFTSIIARSTINRGLNGTFFYYSANSEIDLPNGSATKQDWKPFGLSSYHDLMGEVIRRLSESPTTGGSLTDYFYDYTIDPSVTRKSKIFAEKFGENTSGVTLDPLLLTPTGEEEGQTAETDNIIYKNQIIVKGASDGGSLPMEHARFQSAYFHGMERPVYSTTESYAKGDVVRTNQQAFPQTRFFTAKQAVSTGSSSTPKSTRTQSDANWQEDFTINPSVTSIPSQNSTDVVFFSYTPWTNLLNTFKRNMVGASLSTANDVGSGGSAGNIPYHSGSQYTGNNAWKGYMVDWNIGRTNYANTVPDNFFEQVSVKYFTAFKNAADLNEIATKNSVYTSGYGNNFGRYDGNRWIVSDNNAINGPLYSYDWLDVGSNGEPEFVASGSSTNNNKNKIIEWDSASGAWAMSRFPINIGSGTSAQRDTVNCLADGKVYKFNGIGFGGTWDMSWQANTDTGLKNAGTPFHLVHKIERVTGATGLADQAISVYYDWKTNINVTTYPNWSFGTDQNLSSRGAWINLWFPYPKDTGDNEDYEQGSDHEICDDKSVGRNYGFVSDSPYLSTNNMSRTHLGKTGWNKGLESEDMGNISAIRFKMKLSLWQNEGADLLTIGKADFPMIFWAMDKFDRVCWQEFTLRVNDQWQDVILPFGESSGMEMYFSRVDEAVKINGYLLPYDFMLVEREYTGVAFDWRYVKCIGWFYKENYSESGFYNGNNEAAVDTLSEFFDQMGRGAVDSFIRLTQGLPQRKAYEFMVAGATIALDELHFVKDLYVNTDRQTVSAGSIGGIADPRTDILRKEDEIDYLNALALGNAKKARLQFFPQSWHVDAQGDTRLQLGKRFTVTGSRVPYNDSDPSIQTMNLVVQEVKHIIDSDGYFCEVHGIRKFVLETGDTDQP